MFPFLCGPGPGGNVLYRTGSISSGTATTSPVTVNKAVGQSTGDFILLTLFLDGNTGTVTWPAGFTQIVLGQETAPDGETIGLAYKFDGGSEPATYTVTHTYGAFDARLECTAWQNVNTGTPTTISTVSVSLANNASPITLALTGLTLASGSTLILVGSVDCVANSNVWNATPVSGFTQISDGSFNWVNGFFQYQENYAVGATGTINVTSTRTTGAATAGWIGYQLELHKA